MDISVDNLVRLHTKKTHIYQRKANLKKETEPLLNVARNNAIKTNYVEAKIDNIQQKSKYNLVGGDKMITPIVKEYSKLAQKDCMTAYAWLGKSIFWELCI